MKQQNIICVSMTTWEGDYMKAVVHMMGHLAKNNNVLFIDYAFTFKDLIKGLFGQSNIPIKRMIGISSRLRTITYQGNKLHHLTLPPILPINWINNTRIFDLVMNFQIWLVTIFSIKGVLRKLDFKNPIMINAFNPLIGVAMHSALKTSKLVYYCYDEIGAASWCNKHGIRLEEKLAKEANMVVVTSTALLKSKIKLNPNTLLIKNGVDFNLFHQAYNPNKSHDAVEIGYIGSLDFRVDYELLKFLIKSNPDYMFKFLGRIMDQKNCEILNAYSNVKFLGAQKPENLPGLMAEMDVAIIPFIKNDFTRNIYPLKINEYLAAGLPVVSTDFADMSDFQGLISIENEAFGFGEALRRSISQEPSIQAKCIEMARVNDWSNRSLQFENALTQLNHEFELAS